MSLHDTTIYTKNNLNSLLNLNKYYFLLSAPKFDTIQQYVWNMKQIYFLNLSEKNAFQRS